MTILDFHCRHRYRSGFELDAAFAMDAPMTALVGPSGSGKTTILEAIAGVLRPDRGRICLEGRALFESADGVCVPPERRGIGCVFQDFLLFPHMTVERNLRYGLKRRGPGKVSLEAVAKLLDLGDLLGRYPATLSGGQRQRTALGRALLCTPRLLVMDEPVNAQDAELRTRILEYLERIVYDLSVPTLLVSHDVDVVSRLGARCLQVHAGHVTETSVTAKA